MEDMHPVQILLVEDNKTDADLTLRAFKKNNLTSSAEERDVVESYRLGVNSYLVKPADFGQFVETVSHGGLVLGGVEQDSAVIPSRRPPNRDIAFR